MFRTLASVSGVGNRLFLFHPTDLIAVLELAWDRRADVTTFPLGHPSHRSDLNRFEDTWFGSRALSGSAPTPPGSRPNQPDLNPIISSLTGETVAVLSGTT